MKKNQREKLHILFIILLVLGGYLLYTYYADKGIDIDKRQYPITGIDVSNHVGKIDFEKIKEQDIDFVYIKATEGKTFIDKSFQTNFRNAKKAGIPTSAYHFFRFNRTGKEQAANFLNTVPYNDVDLPLVVDVEEWGNTNVDDVSRIVTEIKAFIREVEKVSRLGVIIYTNENGYKRFIENNFDNKIWICSFSKQPKIDKKWHFWQHSHKGKIKGANKHVDLNTFNGSRADWEAYLKKLK